MNNKIVILNDSVTLYQHYIDDAAWEKTMGFPRGGLTYLISNNNIKFYAFIDYFYRNCLMTLDLPLYLVDEELGIDGEYDDIHEITEILNRIFPVNSDRDLSLYLRKSEAAETYQPIGDYQPSGDYFDGVEYDESGKTIDFYSQGVLVDSLDATKFIKDGMVDTVSLIELSGDTYLHIVFNTDAGKEPIDINLGDLFDADNYYTKAEADETFQPIGDYLTKESGDTLYQPIGDYQPAGDYLTKESGDTLYQPVGDYLTKESGDTIYQPVGDYALKSEIPSLDGYASEAWVLSKGYINQIKTINNQSLIGTGNIDIGSGGTIDAYTKAESDERFQPKGEYVSNSTFITYITNLTQQIETLQEIIEECCTGQTETLYRWITLTGPNDYICSGTTKYAKEQKQQSTDNGATWQNVSPAEYRTGVLLETDSPDCGYEPIIEYRWVTVSGDYVCSGTTKYNKEKKQYRVDGGSWIDTNPLETRRGSTVLEINSTDCGYVPIIATSTMTYKAVSGEREKLISSTLEVEKLEVQLTAGTYTSIDVSDGNIKYGTFNYTSNSALGRCTHTAQQISHSEFWQTALTTLNVGEGITYLDAFAINKNDYLTSVTLPSTLTGLTVSGLDTCSALTSVTVNALVPPTVFNETTNIKLFGHCHALQIIKVPASAVNTYKNDSSWGRYANIIQAI